MVFVWFQETARLLQKQIQTDSVRDEGREGNALVCKTLTGELLIQQVGRNLSLMIYMYVCMRDLFLSIRIGKGLWTHFKREILVHIYNIIAETFME